MPMHVHLRLYRAAFSPCLARGVGALGGAASCGSWACTPGGWDSPNARPSTEWFYVLSGRGAVTDPDGTPHPFGPGDVVVLPKGWYGRWDITEHIHKIWLTLTHDDVPGASLPGSPCPGPPFLP